VLDDGALVGVAVELRVIVVDDRLYVEDGTCVMSVVSAVEVLKTVQVVVEEVVTEGVVTVKVSVIVVMMVVVVHTATAMTCLSSKATGRVELSTVASVLPSKLISEF